MANIKFTDLTRFQSNENLDASDVIPIVDISDTTMSDAGTNKKIDAISLSEAMGNLMPDDTMSGGAIVDSTILPDKLSAGAPRWTATGNFSIGNSSSLSDLITTIGKQRLTSGTTSIQLFTNNTDTPTASITKKEDVNSQLIIRNEGTSDILLNQGGSGNILLYTNSSERMRINASGNVSIGKSSATSKLDVEGTVTATQFSGPLSGKSTSADYLHTARDISISGAVTGTATSFNGSYDITIPTTLNEVALNKLATGPLPTGITIASANIVDGTIVNSDISTNASIVDTKLATISTAGKVANSATSATANNDANTIVARDASKNFSAGTITATLSGNASTATKLAAGKTISLTGDVTYTSPSFDGSGNVTGAATIANDAVTFAKMQKSAAAGLSIIGRSVSGAGDFAEIASTGNDQVLRRVGDVISWGPIGVSAVGGTSTNSNNTVVARDDSGNFASNIITANSFRARGGGPGANGISANGYSFSGTNNGDTDSGMFSSSDGNLEFYTNNSERMRFDSTGRLLRGVTSSVSTGGWHSGVQLHNTATSNGASLAIARYANDSSGGSITLAKSRSGITGTVGATVANDDTIGVINFAADDGTDLNSVVANIGVTIDGTPGPNQTPGRMAFATTGLTGSSATERMCIDSSGRVGIAKTNPEFSLDINSNAIRIDGSSNAWNGIVIKNREASTTVAKGAFLDHKNENNQTIASYNSWSYGDGSSDLIMNVTPAGLRTSDRRIEAIRIKGSGNVGIGTNNPSAPLTVIAKNAQNNPGLNAIRVVNTGTSNDDDAYVAIHTTGNDGGNPIISWDINGVSGFCAGIDNRDDDKFKIASNWNTLTSGTRITIQRDGNVGIGTTTPSSLLHVNGTITATTFSGTATNSTKFDGILSETFASSLRANANISGGGTISVTSGGSISWTHRFIVISNGRGSYFSSNGYFDASMPPVGTVITGVGNAANVTVDANGIALSAWQALYYILPIGSFNTTVNGNYRIVGYTADLEIPYNWMLICVRNGDSGTIKFNTGHTLNAGQSLNTAIYNSTRIANADSAINANYAASAGNAATVTNGVYTSGDQTINNTKTFTAGPIIQNGSPTIFFRDTDHRSAMIRVDNNAFYVLRGSDINSTSWTSIKGRWPLTISLETNDATFGGTINALDRITIHGGSLTGKYGSNVLAWSDDEDDIRYHMSTRGTLDGTNASWKMFYHSSDNGWFNTFGIYPESKGSRVYAQGFKDNVIYVSTVNNVGIGKTDPGAKLDVAGDARASRFYGPVTGNVTGDLYGTANKANQLQSFTADNFTGGNHFIKAIREDGWRTRLKTCYDGGAATTNDVVVGQADYSSNSGYAYNYPNRYFLPNVEVWTVNESGYWGSSFYTNGQNAYIDINVHNLAAAGWLYNGSNYAVCAELRGYEGTLFAQSLWYPAGNSTGRVRLISSLNLSDRIHAPWRTGFHLQLRDHHSGRMSIIWGVDFDFSGGRATKYFSL